MKKVFLTAVLTSLIFILTGCFEKDYPVDKITLGEFIPGSTIEVEAETPIELKLSGIVQDTDITALLGGEECKVNGNEISLLLNDIQNEKLEITLSSKGYLDTTLSWNVRSLPHPIKINIEENIGEVLSFPENTQSASFNISVSRENAEIKIFPQGMGEFKKESQKPAFGSTKGILTLKLPEKGNMEYTIEAEADKSETVRETVKVTIIPSLNARLSQSNLTLLSQQTASITLISNAPDTVWTASVTSGNASASITENILTVTGGDAASVITISGQAPDFLPYQSQITVNVAVPQKTYEEKMAEQQPTYQVSTNQYFSIIEGILKETNKVRKEYGLSPLAAIKAVDTPAMIRAKETNTLWSHTRPDGREFHTVFEDVGLSYRAMGENLFSANSYFDPEEVVAKWMASEGHRKNILNSSFTGLGVGYYEGSEYSFWVQLFVG